MPEYKRRPDTNKVSFNESPFERGTNSFPASGRRGQEGTMWGRSLKAASPEGQSSEAKNHRGVQLRDQFKEGPARVYKLKSPESESSNPRVPFSVLTPLSRIKIFVCF